MSRLDAAKKGAARRISRQVNIRGFRKGKAPYRRVVQTVGEATILEEAIDDMRDALYKESLEESGVAPYGPASMDDFKLDPAPTFVFTVPLLPEVDLKDYRDIRIDYESPSIADAQVEAALKQLQLQHIEVLDDDVKVTAPGNRVQVRIESEFVDGDDPDAADDPDGEDDAPADEDPTAPVVPKKGDPFVNEDNATFILDPNEDSFIDGFVEALLDCELGSDVIFELTIPDDDADATIIGRRVEFVVEIKRIEAVKIPALDDAFAARMGKLRDEQVDDFAGLQRLVRQDLEASAADSAKRDYASQVIERMKSGADMKYPDIAVHDVIDELMEDFKRRLQSQGIEAENFLRLTESSDENIRENFRDRAVDMLQERLVLSQFVKEQEIDVADKHVEGRLAEALSALGFDGIMRQSLDTPQLRDNFRNELLTRIGFARLCAIGMGEDPAAAQTQLEAELDVEFGLDVSNDESQNASPAVYAGDEPVPAASAESQPEHAASASVDSISPAAGEPSGDTESDKN